MKTKKHSLGWPVFSLAFTPSNELLVGGGGGSSRAGINNLVVLFSDKMEVINDYMFGNLDDGCMSLSVHPKVRVITQEKAFIAGVNHSEDLIEKNQNLNLRIFLLQKQRLKLVKEIPTVKSTDPYHHQKVAKFSPDGKYFATGSSDGRFMSFTWPSLEPLLPERKSSLEICDVHFDATSSKLCFTSPKSVQVLGIAKNKILWSLEGVVPNCDFRAARFGCKSTANYLYLVLNAKSRKEAYIQKYSIDEKKLILSKKLPKPVTAFTLR
jgi:prolactin regulatory element-binding protein